MPFDISYPLNDSRMTFRDFITFFHRLEITNLTANSSLGGTTRQWKCAIKHGSWKKAVSAGGCRNYPS